MRLPLAFTLASLTFAACGGGDDGGTSIDAGASPSGFDPPPVTLKANTEISENNWMELGDADLSCLATPNGDMATTVDVELTTTVIDFQSKALVPNAEVIAFQDQDSGNPFDNATSDSSTAQITLTVPSGTKRFGYKMTSDTQMPTFLFNQKLDSTSEAVQTKEEIKSVSNATGATLPALIGQTRMVGTGIVAGALRDCQGHEISGFVATMSSTPTTATRLEGSEAYYFESSIGLPVNHRKKVYSSQDGLFMIIQVPVGTPTGYVQMWGFPPGADTSGAMQLIAELQVPLIADTVITGSYEPLRN